MDIRMLSTTHRPKSPRAMPLRTIDECRPWLIPPVVGRRRLTDAHQHVRCVQALVAAACRWQTTLARCAHATLDAPRLMPLPLADVVCPMRTCEVRCVQALADASNFCLASHGVACKPRRCRPADRAAPALIRAGHGQCRLSLDDARTPRSMRGPL
ncbi:hypothetical protein H5410_014718 [Solanum commersonii]|uniref:Uncharacterized protein n=1 Tax=Solanum commersonii TaxID=4109 RepID=A0A9J5ZRR0_SOLCO|nr:hypothetical protein H5410_014718 [Solanum commersonii]